MSAGLIVQPRPYQREALDAIHAAAARGVRRPVLVLPTGAGKTCVFSWLLQERGGRAVVLAHRDELVRQAAEKIHMIHPSARIGIVKAEEDEVSADIVVASIQTLARPNRLAALLASREPRRDLFKTEPSRPITTVVADECFPAGTMVGGKRIEDLVPGDLVPAYDGRVLRLRRVLTTMTRAAGALVRVRTARGVIVCTPNHPLRVSLCAGSARWLPAGDCMPGDMVLCSINELRDLREDNRASDETPTTNVGEDGTPALQQGVWPGRSAQEGDSRPGNGEDKSTLCLGSYEGQQPHDAAGVAREAAHDTARHGLEAAGSRGERPTDTAAAAPAGVPSRVGGGGGDSHPEAEGAGATDLLQSGHRQSNPHGLHRGGRRVAQLPGSARTGQEENGLLGWARVDSVEVLESGSDGTFGGVCANGRVYNLEVEHDHTYVADGFVVHNCHHHTGGEDENTFGAVLKGLGAFDPSGPLTLGVTATPERADGAPLGAIWEEIVYKLSILDGMKQGWLCDVRAKQVKLKADFSKLHVRAGEFRDDEAAEMLMAADAPKHAAQAWLDNAARDMRTVIFTPTVAVAHAMAHAFSERGVRAEAVSGETPTEERRALLGRFHRGETTVVANCQILTEGWDEPAAACAIMARPTRSRPFAIQMVGRVLRPYPGKAHALILDLVGSTVRMDLVTVASLFDVRPEAAEAGVLAALEAPAGGPGRIEEPAPDGKLISVDVSLFQRREFAWVDANGRFVLSLGADGNIVLEQTDVDAWDVVQVTRQQLPGRPFPSNVKTPLYRGLSLGYAQGVAEDLVRSKGAQKLNDKGAPWRKLPASEKQIAYLQRRNRWRDGMSRGEATELMTALMAGGRRR